MSELFARTDRLRGWAGLHDRIATDLSQLSGGVPEAAGVQASQGSIAAGVGAALSSALNARLGTVQGAADDGSTIFELLRKAEQLYEQGDREGAETLRTAAEELADQRDTPGQVPDLAAGAGVPLSGEGAAANNQMIGQALGQVGALAGAVTAPLLGLAQGLQQVPQQIMQAAQGATTSAAEDPKRRDRKSDDAEKRSEEAEEPSESTRPAQPSAQAAPQVDAPAPAPVPPVVAEPPRPAQTRPQVR